MSGTRQKYTLRVLLLIKQTQLGNHLLDTFRLSATSFDRPQESWVRTGPDERRPICNDFESYR